MITIKQETFDFLSQLIANNNREWFQLHKDEYLKAKDNVDEFTNGLIKELQKIDPSIPENLSAKKSVMRIYRDVRFSKDKSPYKSNFGIGISSSGRGGETPGYYLHIQPGKSFVAGGYWMPNAEHLKAIRQEIDYNTQNLLNIIEHKEFSSFFTGLDEEEKLKTSPKGYESNHEYIELLKLKSFTATKYLKDKELLATNSLTIVIKGFRLLYPFNTFLKQAISNE